MPSAAWIAAAKRTPLEPVFFAVCESVDAINVTQHLASDWSAGTSHDIEVFSLQGVEGGAGIRPKLYTFSNTQVNWAAWGLSAPPARDQYSERSQGQYLSALGEWFATGGRTPWINAPADGYLESIDALWQYRFHSVAFDNQPKNSINGWSTFVTDYVTEIDGPNHADVLGVVWVRTQAQQNLKCARMGLFAAGESVPATPAAPAFPSTTLEARPRKIYPNDDAALSLNFRVQTGTFTTKSFDLGTSPNIPSRVLIEDLVTGNAAIAYSVQGSDDDQGWVELGSVVDGGEIAPHRYYRITAVMTSTAYDIPELYSIRIVGGNAQYVNLSDHAKEPVLPLGEVHPYLKSITSTGAKIALKDNPTLGSCTIQLLWMPATSNLVQSTGKRRSVTVYLGFKGLARDDYEEYFTGIWDGYTADQEKRIFTIKLRDVWNKFQKKKVPTQQIKDGAAVPISYQFGKATDGAGLSTELNILDCIVEVATMAKASERYLDRAAFSALKASSFSGPEWNVYRTLTEQKDSSDLLKELAITAGVFLVPSPAGKLTPIHYDTAIAQEPAVTLDAAQIQFSNLTPDMSDTVTRHNVYFNLGTDNAGLRKSGGNPSDYQNVYTTVGSHASVVAERDREEVVVGEWFDNWGLAAATEAGTPNPLTMLADRLSSWYTPIASIDGKDVATTKTTVQASNVPLRYYADVQPGRMVYVDNLRLPCPLSAWGGFSNKVKFMVMSWAMDEKNYTLKLDLFQVTPLTYTESPSWQSYKQWDLFPQASNLQLAEHFNVGTDGSLSLSLNLTFTPPSDYRVGYYEVWVSENGSDWSLATKVPAAPGSDVASASIPARSGVNYQVAVVTVNGRDKRQPIEYAPQLGTSVQGVTGIPTPPDAGLHVSGGETEFTGRDCLLTWDASSLPKPLLGGYRVEILDLAGTVVRSAVVADAMFRYTFGMNFDDFGGAPASSFQVRVATINTGGSAATPQTITVSNSVPSAPTSLAAAPHLMSVELAAGFSAPDDFDCLEIWAATTNDRSTIGAAPAGTTKTSTFSHDGLSAWTAHYYWIRVRDLFGQVSGWYPASATGGIPGEPLSDPTSVLTLLNKQITSAQLTQYLQGNLPFSDLLDTVALAGGPAVGQEGVFAQKTEVLLKAASQASAAQEGVEALIASLGDTASAAAAAAEAILAKAAAIEAAGNANESAQSAQASAELATAKSDSAQAAAAAAVTSKDQAASYVTAAETASAAASSAATTAEASQVAAGQKATAAATSATSAASSSTDAGSSASSAAQSATSAAASSGTAGTYATQASQSASGAATSATTAGTHASNASASAGTAATYASTATTKAGDAAASASAAAASAVTASTKAGDALTSANSAASSSSAAQTASSSASTYASNASGYATTASEAASTASNAASTITAQYTIKVDVNGKIAGIGLWSSSGAPSLFEVVADRFAFCNTSGTGTTVPFIIDSGTVYMATAMIKDASVTSAKIYSLATDKLYAGSALIGTALIADAAITNAKIGNLSVSNTKIQDAAITTAKIGTAQVDTLQIKGQAVVLPVAVTDMATTVVTAGEWLDVLSLSMDNTGSPVVLTAGFTIQSGVLSIVRILRNGVVVYEPAGGLNFSSGYPMSFSFYSTPTAGTNVFKLQLYLSQPQYVYAKTMWAIEVKR